MSVHFEKPVTGTLMGPTHLKSSDASLRDSIEC